jgi:hypothetical protein
MTKPSVAALAVLAFTAMAQVHAPGTHAVRCQINKEQLIVRDRAEGDGGRLCTASRGAR